jgi:DNA-binding transcriptional ArsR family regulator
MGGQVRDSAEVKELARLFKSLSDETRLRLLKLLAEQGPEGALCVGALAMGLGVTQSATSQHLAVLRAAGLVVDERRGYFVHYRLNYARLGRWREQLRTALGEELAEALAG